MDNTKQAPQITQPASSGAPSGIFADPAQVGAMIQKTYPVYASMDPTVLGQRWIALHTPKPSTALGVGTPLSYFNSDETKTPDLSGLSKFATPVKPKQQSKPNILNSPSPAGQSPLLGQGNQLAAQQPQQNTPWLGSQIAGAWNKLWNPVPQMKPINLGQ